MIVMKFGGTSVGSTEQIRAVAGIVAKAQSRSPVVVLSAMAGMTDRLIEAGEKAGAGQEAAVARMTREIRSRHDAVISGLIRGERDREALRSALQPVWAEMEKVFTGVLLLRELSPRSRDLIATFGERLIVPIFAACLREEGIDARPLDSRSIVTIREETEPALVDFKRTRLRCRKVVTQVRRGRVPVLGGFISATPDGITTTLGRGGSDYTASVIGHSIAAEEIEIWTDVDGVMTADPRIVPGARVLEQISYKEAAEMAYFGAKVLHPKTITPAADLGIPIRIRNTMNPGAPGTLITAESPPHHQGVKTVTSINELALVSIEGPGMIGVPGTAERAFRAIAEQRINVLMFSQGSSEQHISLVVARQQGPRTVRALRREFRPEIEERQVDRVSEVSEIAVIALVGEGMKSIPGIAARTFGAIGDPPVNILMIAQGSSELNLSFVVEQRDAASVVARIHGAFRLGAA